MTTVHATPPLTCEDRITLTRLLDTVSDEILEPDTSDRYASCTQTYEAQDTQSP